MILNLEEKNPKIKPLAVWCAAPGAQKYVKNNQIFDFRNNL